jgi:hypothetical protein
MYINRAINREYITLKDDGSESVDVTTPGLRKYYKDEDEYGVKYPRKLLNESLELCNKLTKIVKMWDKIKDYSSVKLLLKCNENAKLFLSSYLYRFDTSEITENIVLDICECLLRLFTVLELSDAGYSSSKFKTFLFSVNIKLVDKNISIETIKNDFNEHIKKDWTESGISDSISDYDKNLLVFLNEFIYSKNKTLKFDFAENVNVEHIMPASGRNITTIQQDAGITNKEEFIAIVNKLGNKILLEEDINKSIGNEWFKTKKQNSVNTKSGYKDSRYAIALALTSFPNDTWIRSDIDMATDKAVDRIVKFIFNMQ